MHRGFVAHIGLKRRCVASGVAYGLGHAVGGRAIEIGDKHCRASCSELQGAGFTDSRACSGDDRPPTPELCHADMLLDRSCSHYSRGAGAL